MLAKNLEIGKLYFYTEKGTDWPIQLYDVKNGCRTDVGEYRMKTPFMLVGCSYRGTFFCDIQILTMNGRVGWLTADPATVYKAKPNSHLLKNKTTINVAY